MDVQFPPQNSNLPPFKPSPWMKTAAVFVFIGVIVSTMFYQVEKDEAGVVQRFGKYVRTTNPGLHFKLPAGMETVKKIKVTAEYEQEFGYRTISRSRNSIFQSQDSQFSLGSQNYLAESIMLTGDLNVAQVEWTIKYNVNDPVAFAFKFRDPHGTIRDITEAVVRLVVGDHVVDEVITTERTSIRAAVKTKLQEVLDSYGIGITINLVNFKNNTPPAEVAPSFQEVNEVRQEQDTLKNQALQEYNRVIPKAKGQAEQMLRGAEGYALERVNRAQGDAERFVLSWTAYKEDPAVTKKRLLLETLSEVLPSMKDKMIIDESTQKGILPLLSLNQEAK